MPFDEWRRSAEAGRGLVAGDVVQDSGPSAVALGASLQNGLDRNGPSYSGMP